MSRNGKKKFLQPKRNKTNSVSQVNQISRFYFEINCHETKNFRPIKFFDFPINSVHPSFSVYERTYESFFVESWQPQATFASSGPA